MMRLFLAAFLLAAAACAQSVPPSEANRTAREWFQNARFGMFIHWGAYSVVGDGEWVMNNRKMTVADYEKLAPRFNPAEFHPAHPLTSAPFCAEDLTWDGKAHRGAPHTA